MRLVAHFPSKIFTLDTGRTNNNLIVPLVLSPDTISAMSQMIRTGRKSPVAWGMIL